jgi:SAM-dependent methyltransferase
VNTFVRSASVYDKLYEEKDYLAEAKYIHDLIQRYAPGSKAILDLGCGTGRHSAHLAKNGYTIIGIDRSKAMLSRANAEREKLPQPIRERLSFREDDIRTARLSEKFDVVVALFHVISYQTSNQDLLEAFTTVRVHLRSQGLFIFDFWYGPGVIFNQPTVRVKRAGNEKHVVLRIAEPTMHVHENTVDVNYLFIEAEQPIGSFQEFRETHKMRYFFKPELLLFLQYAGLKPLSLIEWMTESSVTRDTWSATLVAQRVE